MKRLVFIVLAISVIMLPATAATASVDGVREAPTLRSDAALDREALETQRAQTHAWLMAERVDAGLERPLRIQLSSEELRDIEKGMLARGPEALRVGLVKPTAVAVDLVNPERGALKRAPDGGIVWTGVVRSDGAMALRLHFVGFALPRGTELYLYTEAGEVFGPYTGLGPSGDGDFWSHTVTGAEAILQLRQYGDGPTVKRLGSSFRIADVGHIGSTSMLKYNDPAAHPLCSFNADCVENASCYNEQVVADAKYAVAHMQYVKRPYIYFCSGGLLNNTLGDQTPYFLTANHCISRDREAATLEAYFQFWTDCNSPDCPEYNQISTPRTLGSSVVSTSSTSDYTLLRLSEPAPAGSAFLGWNATAIAFTSGADLYRIAHPGGAPQSYSYHTVDTAAGTCTSWPRGAWIYSYDVVGATEGGSSGSPVLNAAGQVVGQLSGGCGTNVNDNCDNDSNATVDGAFANYFDDVAQYLDPAGCPDADADGYTAASCGGTDCDDSDPAVNPGAIEVCDGIDNDCDGTVDEGCTTCVDADGDGYDDAACGGTDCDDTNSFINPGMAEVCDNGIDDDCDGAVDGEDSECTATCQPAGADCTSNEDCCSLRCHPRFNYCK
jgi:hypothetical protein